MHDNFITIEEKQKLHDLVLQAKHIVVIGHTNPDGDAIGSITALNHVLHRLGKEATAIVPDKFPDNLKWIPGADGVLIYESKQQQEVTEKIMEADLVFMVDHNEASRTRTLADTLAINKAPRVMIDHHPNPEEGLELTFSHPELCAAGEVLLRIMLEMGWADELTYDEAVCLYTSLMTDTGAFTFNSNRPELYELIALLLRTGIDKDKLYRNVYWTCTPDRIKLTGYMLYSNMQLMTDCRASLMTLTNEERRHFQLKNGDTDGIVNMPLQIDGMRLSIMMQEDTEHKDEIRVSLRSVDDFPCNEMSKQFFNGGGHKNASGGRLHCTMDEAIETAHKAIKAFKHLLCLVLVATCALSSMTSCKDDETYAEQKEKERKGIEAFIKRTPIVMLDANGDTLLNLSHINVISEEQFEKQDSMTDVSKNEFVLFSNTGVYMQIVRKGVGEKIKTNESKRVICRYWEYNILGDSLQSTDMVPFFATNPEILDVSNNGGTISASFNTEINGGGAMYMTYSGNSHATDVPKAWLKPLYYINLGRQTSASQGIAKVRLIAPHGEGQNDATTNVYPCFYEITYQEMRD